MTKRNRSVVKGVVSLLLIIPSIYRFIIECFSLLKYEARLAGKRLFIISLLVCLSAALLVTIWLCMLFMLMTYLMAINFTVMGSLIIILLLNILLFMLCLLGIYNLKNKLSFPDTAQFIKKISTDEVKR